MPPKKKAKLRETDLYAPIRAYLEEQGYTVRSEVLDCDVAAVKDDELILIELKVSLTLGLLVQATRRQRASDSVYVALPDPATTKWTLKWKDAKHLLRRLELGLILVDVGAKKPKVEIAFHPEPLEKRKQPKKRRAILREVAGRSGDYNEGGSTRRKILTAYRESAIQIACYLDALGPSTPRQLRTLGASPKTGTILYHNVYGWFERVDRGVYALVEAGRADLDSYPKLTALYRERLDAAQRESA
jgi:hypothetical protein